MIRGDIQENWFALVKATHPTRGANETTTEIERKARQKLAALLREYAEKVENQNPDVFGYYEARNDGPFDEIRVVLSRPWGG